VRAFAWCQDDCEPVSFDFALSLGSRNFQITESVLHDLELICASDVTPDLIRLQKYDTAEGLWVGFKIGQAFDAESHRRRFLIKCQEVKKCVGFESCVEQVQGPHMRENLTGERRHVREILSQKRTTLTLSPFHSPSSAPPPSAPPPPVCEKSLPPLSAPPPPVHKRSSAPYDDMTLISSDDEAGSTTPIWPLVTPSRSSARPGDRPAPHAPEVILVLDSDEEWEAAVKGLSTKGPMVKQEQEVRIKMEPGVEHWMDSHTSRLHRRQCSGESIRSSRCKTDMSPHLSMQQRRCRQPSGDSFESSSSSGETETAGSIFYSEDEDKGLKWPQDYHVCDVVTVFKKTPRGISKKAAFAMHFPGLQFKKSTFYDNYNLWMRTPVAFRTRYADYGWTNKGSWKVFLTARARYFEKQHEKQEKHKKRRVEKEKGWLSS
jgi:GTP cyclohydrolase II